MGALADKSNLRLYLPAGLIASAALNLILGSTRNLYVMMVLMVLMAITQGMGAPSCQKLVQVWWSKKYKGVVYSIWSSAHNAGAFACVAVVELSATLFGHDNVAASFYTASVISTVIAVIIYIFGSDRPTTRGLPTVAEYNKETVILHDGSAVAEDKTHLNLKQLFIKYILKNKAVWVICLTSMSLYIIRYGVMSWIPSYLSEAKGFDKAWAKWLVGLFEVAAVPGVIILGAVSDFIKGKRAPVCLACVIILSGCMLVYTFSYDHALIIIALVIMGNMIYTPITLVGLMVNEAVPKFAVGSSTGFMGFFQYVIGEICATAVIGKAVDAFGWSGQNVIIAFAITLTAVLLCYLIYSERKRDKLSKALQTGLDNKYSE
jgi:OPA family glycerol-3-phosphate transporter-like MFS transporter